MRPPALPRRRPTSALRQFRHADAQPRRAVDEPIGVVQLCHHRAGALLMPAVEPPLFSVTNFRCGSLAYGRLGPNPGSAPGLMSLALPAESAGAGGVVSDATQLPRSAIRNRTGVIRKSEIEPPLPTHWKRTAPMGPFCFVQ